MKLILTKPAFLGIELFPQKSYQNYYAPTGNMTLGKKSGEIFVKTEQCSSLIKKGSRFCIPC